MTEHILLSFYLGEPVFSKSQMSELEVLIADYLPNWGATYHLSEDDPKFGAVKKTADQRLSDALNDHFPVKWGQGSAVLSGDRDGVVIFLDTSQSTLPPELNSIGVEIVGIKEMNGKPIAVWAEEFFSGAIERLSVRYGCVYDKCEFEAKNMVRDDSGVSAVGVRLGAAIPGLYWLNFFGAPYLQMISVDRFASLQAGSVAHNSTGVVVKLGDAPDEWHTSEYRDAEHQVVEHLGSQFFFDRTRPERETQAPDFKRPA